MPTGKVKFYDQEKGFGFITSDEGAEVFLHASALPEGGVVKVGSRLEFGVELRHSDAERRSDAQGVLAAWAVVLDEELPPHGAAVVEFLAFSDGNILGVRVVGQPILPFRLAVRPHGPCRRRCGTVDPHGGLVVLWAEVQVR